MTKPFSETFKKKMVERLTGPEAISIQQLSAETGLVTSTLNNWLTRARTLEGMPPRKPISRQWTVEEKARVVSQAAKLSGEQLRDLLDREGLRLAQLEQWRVALEGEGAAVQASAKRIRELERELTRKDKALAEAAALLVLKKRLEHLGLGGDEDSDTDEETEK